MAPTSCYRFIGWDSGRLKVNVLEDQPGPEWGSNLSDNNNDDDDDDDDDYDDDDDDEDDDYDDDEDDDDDDDDDDDWTILLSSVTTISLTTTYIGWVSFSIYTSVILKLKNYISAKNRTY